MIKINRLIDHDALEEEDLRIISPYFSVMNKTKAIIAASNFSIPEGTILLDFPKTCLNLMLREPDYNPVEDEKLINHFEVKKVLIFSVQYLESFSAKHLDQQGLKNILGLSPFSTPLNTNKYKEDPELSNKFDREFKMLYEEVSVKKILERYLICKGK